MTTVSSRLHNGESSNPSMKSASHPRIRVLLLSHSAVTGMSGFASIMPISSMLRNQMGRHHFGIALFIAHFDIFLILNGVGGIIAKLPR